MKSYALGIEGRSCGAVCPLAASATDALVLEGVIIAVDLWPHG
jgi:hypothetical protein